MAISSSYSACTENTSICCWGFSWNASLLLREETSILHSRDPWRALDSANQSSFLLLYFLSVCNHVLMSYTGHPDSSSNLIFVYFIVTFPCDCNLTPFYPSSRLLFATWFNMHTSFYLSYSINSLAWEPFLDFSINDSSTTSRSFLWHHNNIPFLEKKFSVFNIVLDFIKFGKFCASAFYFFISQLFYYYWEKDPLHCFQIFLWMQEKNMILKLILLAQ